jgi:hypothetical protein
VKEHVDNAITSQLKPLVPTVNPQVSATIFQGSL